jgi:hypothetical protein
VGLGDSAPQLLLQALTFSVTGAIAAMVFWQSWVAAMHNKPLVPTHNGEASLHAAHAWRWTLRMCTFTLAIVAALPGAVIADTAADFEAAMAKWSSADVKSYSFIYELSGGVVIAPRCADAKIRVVVRNGVSSPPVVAQGSSKCPRGTRGDAIGFSVPATIEAVFAEMHRYVYEPPTPARIEATYEPVLGIPLTYYVEKLEIADNDEGFQISSFKVLK